MKIALYVPSWPPGLAANGIVTYASYLVPALRQLGHEVFVLTYGAGSEADAYTIDLKRFTPTPNLLDRAMSKLAPKAANTRLIPSAIAGAILELVVNHRIDVFEIEESFGWSFAVSRLGLVPVVVRLHGPCFLMGRFDQPHNRKKIKQEGRGIRYADYVTACSADTLNAVKSYYDLRLHKSRVIPNPINAAPEAEIWQANTCNKDNLLYVGRFDKVKGGDLVLLAFRQLATWFPRLTLTFIGRDRGIETAKGKKLFFHEFVRENIPEWVRSRINFREQMRHAEVMSLRTQHFITIVASRYEPQGYVMMEAMSRGCPLVATAVGGIPEFIKDQHNGLLVPPDDPDAMAAACKTLLDDAAFAAQIGRRAWLDCRHLYKPDATADLVISIYNDVINSAKPHSHGANHR
jgi:glycosyltransferase involved in cell wall biosynthesis